MRWAPFVTVAAVIREQDRYLLVEERPDGYPVITQPAGHLEFGESLLDAVQREVREETGIEVSVGSLVALSGITLSAALIKLGWSMPLSIAVRFRCRFLLSRA